MSIPPKKKEYVDIILEQREALKERQKQAKERSKVEAEARRKQRAKERAILRAKQKQELAKCETWSSINKDKINVTLDELAKALDTIEGFGMIGEGDMSVTQWLGSAYQSLAAAMTPDQRVCIDIYKPGADDILDKKLNDLILMAEQESDHLCEEQFRHINSAKDDLVTIAEAIEKQSRGIYEPP